MVDVSKIASEATLAVHQAVEAAYRTGYQDAVAVMMRAAQAQQTAISGVAEEGELPTKPPPPRVQTDVGLSSPVIRARRGLVREALEKALNDQPGLAIAEYERVVTEAEPEISSKSVGNELRRGEGTLYVRDVPKGTRWFLKRANPQLSIGGPSKAEQMGGMF